MSGTTNTSTTGTAIAPEQMAAILMAAAQAIGGQKQVTPALANDATGTAAQTAAPVAAVASVPATAAAPATPVDPASSNAPATPLAANTTPGAIAQQPDATQIAAPGEPESLALLKKIDTNLTDLSTRIVAIEKTAIRNGAIAGGVAGGVSGGIVATGIAFVRAHLGV